MGEWKQNVYQYHLFAGDVYYPQGGMDDWQEASDELAYLISKANLALTTGEYHWYHIVDMAALVTVAMAGPFHHHV